MLEKNDLKGKIGTMYLFTSCGWIHEKDILKFTFSTNKKAGKKDKFKKNKKDNI